jgi:RNA polymerase sigma factor (sigma-70 family)
MEPEAHFRELFESTYPVVARYARHRGFSGQDLEDLVAATYEVAWRRFEQVPAGEAAIPWLLTVALNHVRNRRRKLSRDRSLLQRLAAPEHARSAAEASRYEWGDIRRALDRLSTADRELVLLVAWDGLGPADEEAELMTEHLHDDELWNAVRTARPAPPADQESPFSAHAQALLRHILDEDRAASGHGRGSHRWRPALGVTLTVAFSACVTLAIVLVVVLGLGAGSLKQHAATQGAGRGIPLPAGLGTAPHSFVVAGSARLVATAPDPQGGPAWGVREIRTSRGQVCLAVGRVRNGVVGVLGTHGAWDDDQAFHPLPLGGADALVQQYCGDTDANGNGFLNVIDNMAVDNGAGNGAVDGGGGGASASVELCPRSARGGRVSSAVTLPCPAGSLRSLAYGLLGPEALSITYLGPRGRVVTEPTIGSDGAYLVVARQAAPPCAAGTPTSPRSTCPSLESVAPRLQSGVIIAVHYRSGQVCGLPAPGARGRVRARSCPLAGPPQTPRVFQADVASPVTVSIAPAAHNCVSNAPNPRGCKDVSLDIAFTARVGVHDLNSYYEAVIDMPPRAYTPGGRTGCPGAAGAVQAIGQIVAAGRRVHWHYARGSYPKDCRGNRIQVTVAYIANSYLGLNGLGSKPFPSPGAGAIVVGRATVTMPTR